MQNCDTSKTFLICCALAALTLALYWPVRSHDFINYDDPDYVTGNPVVQRGLTGDGIVWAFKSGHSFNWHPVTWISHMLDWELFEANPGGHHFTNAVFHALNTLLLFLVLRRMTGALWKSAMVAALFAWHPLHIESVAWISERKDVLSTFFWMLTIWFYVRYAESQRPLPHAPKKPSRSLFTVRSSMFYFLALLWFAIGLMTKPMLVTLPFVLLLLDFWPLRRMAVASERKRQNSPALSFRKLIMEKAPFFAIALASSIVTFLVQRSAGAVAQTDLFPINERLGNAAVSYIRYLGKTFWPGSLSVFYPYLGWQTWQVVTAVFILVISSVLVLWRHRTKPFLAVGWFWFLGTLVPVIGLVQVGTQAMADRYTYVPLIGVFIFLIWGAGSLRKNLETIHKLGGGLAASIVLLGCFVVTRAQLPRWRNSETLFSHAVEVTRSNLVARVMLGNALLGSGKYNEAQIQYEEALKLRPDFAEIHFNLGNLFVEQKRLDEAIAHYAVAIEKNPAYANAHVNMAIALGMKGDFPQAISHYQDSLKIEPNDPITLRYLASDLITTGKRAEAANYLKRAIAINPNDAEARKTLQTLAGN